MSRSLLINLLLALVWTAVTGELTALNFGLGYILGYLILLIAQPLIPVDEYARRLWYMLELLVMFLLDLLSSSIRVARVIVTPNHRLNPAVIAVPLDVKSDLEITILANLISLTPGTLTMDHSSDRRYLFVHVMDIPDRDVEGQRRRIKDVFETRVNRAFGPLDNQT